MCQHRLVPGAARDSGVSDTGTAGPQKSLLDPSLSPLCLQPTLPCFSYSCTTLWRVHNAQERAKPLGMCKPLEPSTTLGNIHNPWKHPQPSVRSATVGKAHKLWEAPQPLGSSTTLGKIHNIWKRAQTLGRCATFGKIRNHWEGSATRWGGTQRLRRPTAFGKIHDPWEDP